MMQILLYRNLLTSSRSHFFSIRTFSKISGPSKSKSVIVDFLINKCGLSLKKATTVSKCKEIRSSSIENPLSVISLLEENGFSKARITKIVSENPDMLLLNVDKELKPKFEYFNALGFISSSIARIVSEAPSVLLLDVDRDLKPKFEYFSGLGFSDSDIVKLCWSNPGLIVACLKGRIIPSVVFLKNVFSCNKDVVSAISRHSMLLCIDLKEDVRRNMATLEDIGVPKEDVLKLLASRPKVLTCQAKRFSYIVNEIRQKGFEPLSPMFTTAMHIFNEIDEQTWERRLDVFREFGFTEVEILLTIRIQLRVMSLSEENVRKHLIFFTKQLNWDSAYVSKYGSLLTLSMEKTIMPRLAVLEMLVSEGILARSVIVAHVFLLSENKFSKQFVIIYKESFPQVVKTYQDMIMAAASIASQEKCNRELHL